MESENRLLSNQLKKIKQLKIESETSLNFQIKQLKEQKSLNRSSYLNFEKGKATGMKSVKSSKLLGEVKKPKVNNIQ